MTRRTTVAGGLGALLTVGLVAACGTAEDGPGDQHGTDAPAADAVADVRMDSSIHDALPKSIKDAGEMTVVMNGSSLPYWETTPGKKGEYRGAGAEMMQAVAKIMGVKVTFVAIPDISGAIASISSKRYAFAFAPYGDSVGGPDARPGVEFVDVVQEVVPFLVKAGNPKHVSSLNRLCGIKLAAQVNGGAYEKAVAQSKKCRKQGKELQIVGVTGTPNGILAVRSGRADAFFSSGAALFYAAKSSKGQLEVAGADHDNGYAGLFQGAVLPQDAHQRADSRGLISELLESHPSMVLCGSDRCGPGCACRWGSWAPVCCWSC